MLNSDREEIVKRSCKSLINIIQMYRKLYVMKNLIMRANFNRINKIKISSNIKYQEDSFNKLILILIKNRLLLAKKLVQLIMDSKVQLKKITKTNPV